MNAERLLAHYERVADAPDAISKLRRFILDLAVRGKLVDQDAADEPAQESLHRILTAQTQRTKESSRRTLPGIRVNFNECPFDAPETWHFVRLGAVLELINGRAFKPTEWVQHGLPIVRIQNLNNEQAPFNYCSPASVDERHRIRDGEFLISWSGTPGTSFGAFIWSRGLAALNQHIFRCIHTGDAYVKQFLRLAINSQLYVLIRQAQGGVGLQHVTKGKLECLPIPLPPVAEQHRIVAKVDELMALCDRLEAARANREATRDRLAVASLARLDAPDHEHFTVHARFTLDALPALTTRPDQIKPLRQTILNLAVRGKLVPQDPSDEPAAELLDHATTARARLLRAGIIPRKQEPTTNQATLATELPKQWQPISIGEVCSLVTSGSRGWAEFYASSGPGFIRAQNVRFGKLLLDDLAHVNPPLSSEGSRTQVAKGDLLLVITGAGVTNPALLDCDIGEAYVSQHVALVRPADARLSAWLLLCLMADAGGRAQLVERAYGAGKPGLNLDNIRTLSVPLPPLAEQLRIIAKVGELMATCDQLEANLASADGSRRDLLHAILAEAIAPHDCPQKEGNRHA